MQNANVRIGNVERLPDVSNALGIDAIELFRDVGLKDDTFLNPQGFIPLKVVDDLFYEMQARSGCDHVGLLTGQLPADLGIPAYLFSNAPGLRAAIEDVGFTISLIHSGGSFGLETNPDVATVRYSTFSSGLRAPQHITDCAISQMYGAMAGYCAGRFRATEVRLPRKRPSNIEPFKAHFKGARLVFNSTETAIDFAPPQLRYSSPDANPQLYKFLKAQFAGQRKLDSEQLNVRVRRLLGRLVTDGPVSLQKVAMHFRLEPRRFQELLRAEGTSFINLVHDARHVAAYQMLAHTDLPIIAIASALNYSDASAFTRAFKNRTGLPPNIWRQTTETTSR